MAGGANIWDPGSSEIVINNAAGTYLREAITLTEGQTSVTLTTFKYTVGVNSIQVYLDGLEVKVLEVSNESFDLPFPAAEGSVVTVWGLFGAKNSQTQSTIELVEAEVAAVVGQHVKAGDNIAVGYDPLTKDTTISASTGKAYKNKLINPFFRTDYRIKKAAQTPTAGVGWVCDRWRYSVTQNNKLTFQAGQLSTIPGFETCLKVSVAAAVAPAASDSFLISQQILATNLQELRWNTSAAKPVYIKGAIKSSVSGKMVLKLTGIAGPTYGYCTTVNLVAGQVADFVLEVPGAVVFTNSQGVTPALALQMFFGYGTAGYEPNLNTWKTASGFGPSDGLQFVAVPGATMEITGVELGVGAAGEREYLPLEVEEDLCGKYFERIGNKPGAHTVGQATAATSVSWTLKYSKKMRETPVITIPGGTGGAPGVVEALTPTGTALAGAYSHAVGNRTSTEAAVQTTCPAGLTTAGYASVIFQETGSEITIDADW